MHPENVILSVVKRDAHHVATLLFPPVRETDTTPQLPPSGANKQSLLFSLWFRLVTQRGLWPPELLDVGSLSHIPTITIS